MQNDTDDFIEAVQKIADISFNAADTFGANNIAKRPSGSATTGFYRYGNRSGERSENGAPFKFIPTTCPQYIGPPSRRVPTAEEKRGAWQLQEEYLAGRLGKNEEENGRNWNTAKWIDRLYRIATMPAEALPPFNIYIGDKRSQGADGTGPATGADDEAVDQDDNEGVYFESINVCQTDKSGNTKVMDEDGTTHRLDIIAGDYAILSLIDALAEVDKTAKIDVNDLMSEAPPLLEQSDFPSSDQRAESGKIIRILMLGMRSLWLPVIRSIADHATMKSLGQGKGKDVAAAVGRQRVIEGLRLVESIRRELGRKDRKFSMWQSQVRARQIRVDRPGFSVDDTIKGTLAILAAGGYRADKPLHVNDNFHAVDRALAA
jgi:hypothetical protein